MTDMRLQDVKMTDRIAGHEIAGHEIARHTVLYVVSALYAVSQKKTPNSWP